MGALALLLLAGSLVLPALLAVVMLGMFLTLLLFDRMFSHGEQRAEQLVTKAEEGPDNVVYLSERIEAAHRSQRLRSLLERS
jgi:hypothetical protein